MNEQTSERGSIQMLDLVWICFIISERDDVGESIVFSLKELCQ